MISPFKDIHILVIGDAMIDTYLEGKVHRQSPEAPVPIVDINTEYNHLGGAANVALNLKALGAQVSLITAIGDDALGQIFKRDIDGEGISSQYTFMIPDRCTTQKTRIYNDKEYVLRFDKEDSSDIPSKSEMEILNAIQEVLAKGSIDLVLFQDYNKGLLTPKIIETTIALCNQKGVLTAVDPKKKHFFLYRAVTLFKPNLKEIKEALQREINPVSIDELESATIELQKSICAKNIFITLSEHGVYGYNGHSYAEPAYARNVVDVSGAGDTVISVLALGLAKKWDDKTILSLSNLAGGMACESKGINVISWSELLEEARKKGIAIP